MHLARLPSRHSAFVATEAPALELQSAIPEAAAAMPCGVVATFSFPSTGALLARLERFGL